MKNGKIHHSQLLIIPALHQSNPPYLTHISPDVLKQGPHFLVRDLSRRGLLVLIVVIVHDNITGGRFTLHTHVDLTFVYLYIIYIIIMNGVDHEILSNFKTCPWLTCGCSLLKMSSMTEKALATRLELFPNAFTSSLASWRAAKVALRSSVLPE